MFGPRIYYQSHYLITVVAHQVVHTWTGHFTKETFLWCSLQVPRPSLVNVAAPQTVYSLITTDLLHLPLIIPIQTQSSS